MQCGWPSWCWRNNLLSQWSAFASTMFSFVCLFTYFDFVLSFWYLPLTTSIGLGPFVLWRRSSRNMKTSPQELWGLLKFLRPCGDSAQRHVIWLHGGCSPNPPGITEQNLVFRIHNIEQIIMLLLLWYGHQPLNSSGQPNPLSSEVWRIHLHPLHQVPMKSPADRRQRRRPDQLHHPINDGGDERMTYCLSPHALTCFYLCPVGFGCAIG